MMHTLVCNMFCTPERIYDGIKRKKTNSIIHSE